MILAQAIATAPVGMWDVLLKLVEIVPGILAAWFAYRAVSQGKENHLALNSRMSQLVEVTRTSAHAEGMLQGAKEGRVDSISEHDARKIAQAGDAPMPVEIVATSDKAPMPVVVVAAEPIPVKVISPEERLNQIRGES